MSPAAKRILSLVVAIATAWLSLIAYEWILVKIGAPNPNFWAVVILISILIHEIGHWIMFEKYGIKSYMFFLVILGGAGPYTSHMDKFEKLPHKAHATIMLAGVVGNVLMILGGWMLHVYGFITALDASRIMNLNGVLIFFNLIPFGFLDGGRFIKVFFDTTPERLDQRYAMITTLLVVCGAIVLTVFSREAFFFTPLIVFNLTRSYAEKDDPNASIGPRAMTARERDMSFIAYIVLFVGGMALMSYSQPWLVL